MLRAFCLSLVLAFLAAYSSAFSLDDLNIDGIEAYLHQGQRRQASGTGNSQPPATSSARPPPVTSSRAPPSSARNTPSQPASSEPTSAPQSTPAQSSANSKQASSTPPPPSQASSAPKSASVFTSALVSTSTGEFTSIITTSSDGVAVTFTSVFSSEVPITTGTAFYTDAPSSGSGGNSGSGLSQSNKNIIGGVVGGVGGALLLGGIALVFLRMRKRQSRVHEDDDDMTLGTGSALGDKHVGHGTTPFQSNLEQYHNPGGRPNAAANF